MAPATAAPQKRVRKRKRRQVSSSESSSASSSASGSDLDTLPTVTKKKPSLSTKAPTPSSSSSSSSDESSSSSDESAAPQSAAQTTVTKTKAPSRSPSPISGDLPPFLPAAPEDRERREQELKDKFRKFWMGSVAGAFADDLEQIRKEPNLTTSKLAILIDSLGAGADVFAPKPGADVNEMELVLGEDAK